MEDFFKDIPFGCRLLYLALACLWLTELVWGLASADLLNDPQVVFGWPYQMWRLATASWCQTSLMFLTLQIISLHTFLPKLVRSNPFRKIG